MNLLKTKPIRSKHVHNAARGERCTLQLPCCNDNPETTVLAHLPDESGGMGRKSDDVSACFACSDCHDAIDSRRRSDACAMVGSGLDWYLRRAQTRTARRLVEQGVMQIKGFRP